MRKPSAKLASPKVRNTQYLRLPGAWSGLRNPNPDASAALSPEVVFLAPSLRTGTVRSTGAGLQNTATPRPGARPCPPAAAEHAWCGQNRLSLSMVRSVQRLTKRLDGKAALSQPVQATSTPYRYGVRVLGPPSASSVTKSCPAWWRPDNRRWHRRGVQDASYSNPGGVHAPCWR